MTSGVPWHLRGVRPEVLDSAREAARRSGMSVEEWLDTVISESARSAGIDPTVHRLSDFDERPSPRGASFADVTTRLDALARQVDHLTEASATGQPAPHPAESDDSGRITDVLARLDRKLDRLSALGRPTPVEHEYVASAPSIAGPEGGVDQALAEIEARQRVLDGGAAAPMDLPRAPSQRLPDLEQQLRQINARIDTMRPCNLDGAIETLRGDLAEIGRLLKEAMPRQAIEALESEVRSLAARIDSERDVDADDAAMAGVERGLAEVRDALRALTPAESLVGFGETVQGLSQKIDRIAGSGHDPESLKQLEGAIVTLRGVVSHVASNDTLAQLSEEVRALSAKVDQVTASDAFAAMEQRIAQIADALQQSRGVPAGDSAGLETMVRSLNDKVDQLHTNRADQPSIGYLEERIMRLIDKLDASDARFEHLAAIERGLADLLAQMGAQRATPPRAGSESANADALRRDVRRTQDSLESVHGTLGHVVDRLATIEAGIRDGEPSRAAPPANHADRRVSAAVAAVLASQPRLPFPDLLPSPPIAPEAGPAPRLNPSPPPRRPIDPDLPPDHPLEPGAGRARGGSPADRIAASEAALEHVRPPVIPDPGGKSNFIAAARRAAQAATSATSEAPQPKEKRAAAPAAGGEAGQSLAGKLGGQIRRLVAGAGVILLVLGAIHLATTRPWVAAPPTDEHAATQATSDEAPPAEPPRVMAPASERQSSAPPPGILVWPEATGAEAALPPAVPAAAQHDVTGSLHAQVPQSDFPPSAGPAPLPRVPLPTVPPARGAPADRLPPAFSHDLRAAAVSGDAAAEFEVASRYADGRGVQQNLHEAATWFERAADKGLAPAQFRLGGFYEKGMGVSKNLETARRLYVAAAEAGHAKAMHNLAVLYAEGVEGRPNYATAARWFRKAADHGVIDSQYNLAILYTRGIGVETNLAEAFKWFALASREGDRDAARKRDEIGARLDKPSLTAAMAAAQSWQAQPQPEAATQVRVPPGGWDAAPAPSAKRTIGPK